VPSDDFGLGWVRERVGANEVRRVYVLSCLVSSGHRRTLQLSAVAERFKLVVERFGGQSLPGGKEMLCAVWGMARLSEHDARLAGLAGLAIVADCGSARLPLRCGIVDEDVVILAADANAGLTDGDGVLALRTALLAALAVAERAAPGCVVATQEVARQAHDAFEVAGLQSSGEEVQGGLLRLLARRTGYYDRQDTGAPRLIGRDRELALMEAAWRKARVEGRSATVLVLGEAGIGKTTLARAVRIAVAKDSGLTVRVNCTPEARAQPALPVSELLRKLQFHAGVPSSHARGTSTVDSSAFPAIVDGVLEAARRRPLLLVVEDVHWADEATFAFLGLLIPALKGGDASGLLLVITARTMVPAFDLAGIEVLELGALEKSHLLAILDEAGIAAKLSVSDCHRIVAGAGGNPLLVRELARAWRGDVDTDFSADASDNLAVAPRGLSEILTVRLTALGALKPLAQAAAVLVGDIRLGVLADMLSVDGRWLQEQLGALQAHGILQEHAGRRGRSFRFTHELLRDAACGSLVPDRCRELHRLAAHALADRIDTDGLIEPAEIADQFAKAGLSEFAHLWWRRAADKACADAAPHTGIAHLRRALAAVEGIATPRLQVDRIGMLRQLGVALIQARGSAEPEVRATYEHALELARSTPGVPGTLRFDVLWGLDAYLLAGGEVEDALKIGADLVETGRGLGSQRLMLAWRMHAVAKLLAGAIEDAIALYRGALGLYDRRTDAMLRFEWASDQAVVALAHLSWALSITGNRQASEHYARQALVLAERLQHPHSSAHALGVLATAAQIRGDRGAAGAYAVAGRAFAERHSFPYWVAWCDIVWGWVGSGPMPEDALKLIGGAIASYRATGAGQAMPYALMLLADAELRREEPHRSLAAIAAAREAAAAGITLWDSELYRLEALARRKLGATAQEVDDLLDRGLAIALSQGANAFADRCRAARIAPIAVTGAT
jgi:tetratricopeptide (TPR) repeat protein